MMKTLSIVLLIACLCTGVLGRDRPGRPTTETETGSGGAASADLGLVSLRSCSGVSISSTGGSASAGAGASAKSLKTAAKACANAFADAFASNCNGNAYVDAFSVAETCASALAAVYVEGWSSVYTEPGSRACSYSCASATADASSYSTAFSNAFAKAFNGCTKVQNYVATDAFSKVFVQVMGTIYTDTCAKNGGSAAAEASAFIRTSAASFAAAYGDVWAFACAEGCLGGCGYCDLVGHDLDVTGAFGFITSGTFALAEAFGETVHAACDDGKKEISSTDVNILLKAYVEYCLKIIAKLNNWVIARPGGGEAYACSFSSVSSDVQFAAEAAAWGWTWAFRKNFDGCGSAFSDAGAEVFASNVIDVAFKAYKQVCTKKGEKTKTVQIVRKIVRKVESDPFAVVIADAFAEVINKCPCSSNCFCPCRCGDCRCKLL